MEYDFSKPIMNLRGKQMEDAHTKEPTTLGSTAVGALLYDDPREVKPIEEKQRDYKLALKLHQGGIQEISVTDAAVIIKLVHKVYSTLVAGRVNEIFEQKQKAKANG